MLKFELFGLPDGTYSASITKKSDGSTVVLGSFDYVAASMGDDSDEDSKSPIARSSSDSKGSHGESEDTEVVFGENGMDLPADLNPLDIATVTISSADSVVLLTADFSNDSSVNAMVDVIPGTGAPEAAGMARIKAKSKNGKALQKEFKLTVSKLPASTTFAVSVNGVDVTTVTSSKKGKLNLNQLKKVDLLHVHSVKLHIGSEVAAEANF